MKTIGKQKSLALRAIAKPVLVFVTFLAMANPVRACPMCKDSTVTPATKTATSESGLSFNKSIYFMLGGFATIAGFTGRVMYKAAKSSRY